MILFNFRYLQPLLLYTLNIFSLNMQREAQITQRDHMEGSRGDLVDGPRTAPS